MFRFRLTKLVLKDGTTLEPAQVTVIVGPNNAGKSRFLKEIAGLATKQHTDGLLVRDVESSMPANLEELRRSYDVERHRACIRGLRLTVGTVVDSWLPDGRARRSCKPTRTLKRTISIRRSATRLGASKSVRFYCPSHEPEHFWSI
jgi:ABC-type Mn2+/Zn2+ transport system ATPase subunit